MRVSGDLWACTLISHKTQRRNGSSEHQIRRNLHSYREPPYDKSQCKTKFALLGNFQGVRDKLSRKNVYDSISQPPSAIFSNPERGDESKFCSDREQQPSVEQQR
eukprot:2059351-Pyramimonas_sp.AAC.3